jgi:hypothetical protein
MTDTPPGDRPQDRTPSTDPQLYALEKLTYAVEALATGVGPLQERLMEAAILLESIRSDDTPEGELRRVFAGVKDDLAFEPPRGSDGAIVATLLRTADEDASAIAWRILDLYVSCMIASAESAAVRQALPTAIAVDSGDNAKRCLHLSLRPVR